MCNLHCWFKNNLVEFEKMTNANGNFMKIVLLKLDWFRFLTSGLSMTKTSGVPIASNLATFGFAESSKQFSRRCRRSRCRSSNSPQFWVDIWRSWASDNPHSAKSFSHLSFTTFCFETFLDFKFEKFCRSMSTSFSRNIFKCRKPWKVTNQIKFTTKLQTQRFYQLLFYHATEDYWIVAN